VVVVLVELSQCVFSPVSSRSRTWLLHLTSPPPYTHTASWIEDAVHTIEYPIGSGNSGFLPAYYQTLCLENGVPTRAPTAPTKSPTFPPIAKHTVDCKLLANDCIPTPIPTRRPIGDKVITKKNLPSGSNVIIIVPEERINAGGSTTKDGTNDSGGTTTKRGIAGDAEVPSETNDDSASNQHDGASKTDATNDKELVIALGVGGLVAAIVGLAIVVAIIAAVVLVVIKKKAIVQNPLSRKSLASRDSMPAGSEIQMASVVGASSEGASADDKVDFSEGQIAERLS
jgi:hypothetical protein